MSNDDYSYTNDLDEGGTVSAVARRREQSRSPLAQVVAEMGDLESNYDYLDNSLSSEFGAGFEDVQTALALEDFVGVDGSNLKEELLGSNSVFDIGADEQGGETPGETSQQSVSGTDFDTLPTAPIAKQPIEALPPLTRHQQPTVTALNTSSIMRRNRNASDSNYGTPIANMPNLSGITGGANDVTRAPASPMKYLDIYGVSTPSDPSGSAHQQQCLNSGLKYGKEIHEHAPVSNNVSGIAGFSIGPYGTASRDAPKQPGTNAASPGVKGSSANAASTRAGPPAPPAMQSSLIQNKNDGEGFGFGIETFLHGTQLGFGRQPSFKRIATGSPNLASNTNKRYYLIPGMAGEANNIAAETTVINTPLVPPPRPSGGNDQNAEAFSAWLEALDPKANSNVSSARTLRQTAASNSNNNSSATAAASPSVGEDFKREVDGMMKGLLGDYDLTGGMTGVFMFNSTVSGLQQVALSTTTGEAFNGRRGNMLTGGVGAAGGKDTRRQQEHDVYLKDLRLLTPTVCPPTVTTGVAATTAVTSEEKRKPPSKMTEVAKMRTSTRPSPFGPANATAPKSILSTAATTPTTAGTSPTQGQRPQRSPTQDHQVALAQPPDGGGAQNRRRRVWSNSAPTPSSGEDTSAAVFDPSTEVVTIAEPPETAHQRGSEVSAAAHQTAPPLVGPGPVSRVDRSPRTAATVVAAVSAGKASPCVKTTSPQKALTPRAELAHHNKSPLSPVLATYDDMDEDLLAGGYMTVAPRMRSSESFSDAKSPTKRESDTKTTLMPSSPPEDCTDGSSARGQRVSTMDSHIGATTPKTLLLRQKWHPSWRKSGTSATAVAAEKSPVQVKGAKNAATPSSDAEKESVKTLLHRRASIPSLTENRATLDTELVPQSTTLLPLPSFTPDRATNMGLQRGASASATSPMHQESMPTGASVMTIDNVSKVSRLGFLKRVSAGSSENRSDPNRSMERNSTAPPRRRLMEFRSGGDNGVPPSSSRSRTSVGVTAEKARSEATRQREQERAIQQANEERRQRIQAFMAKRKAEKQMEELRRCQLMERDRQLEAYREEQERQRIHEATALELVTTTASQQQQKPDTVVGSGLNAIKASQRMRKRATDLSQRQSIPTANFIPTASTVPMSPWEVRNEPATGAAPRRNRNVSSSSVTSGAGSKAKVRAVVVFISNNENTNAAKGSNTEGHHPLSTTSASSLKVYEGTSVAMAFDETDHVLKVLQPQERTRYFSVDEYVLINGTNACALSKSCDKGDVAGVGSSHNVPNALRNATGIPRRRLISLTLTEMSRKFLAGVNTALLLASTENAQDVSVLAIREVVDGVVSHMPAQSQLFASIAYVAGGNTEDLLAQPSRSVRSTFRTSPLYGPTLDDVVYVPVTGVGHLLRTIADVYNRVKVGQPQPETGLLVISLLLKQWRDSDVILSSYLISDAGCDGSIYTAILRRSQNAPFALFHSALGGPTLTTALMAADSGDVTTVVQLLNVQHRLSSVMNKHYHVSSVRRFMELAHRELDTAEDSASKSSSYTTGAASSSSHNNNNNNSGSGGRRTSANSLSNSNSKLSNVGRQHPASMRPKIHKRLAAQVAMAKEILDDPEGYLPRGVLSTYGDKGSSLTIPSIPSTAPPAATIAMRARLTKKQEDEVKGLHLNTTTTNVGRPQKVSHTVPATAFTAADATGGNRTTTTAGTTAVATDSRPLHTSASSNGVVLPSIMPGSSASPVPKPAARKPSSTATRVPPIVSTAPLKHLSTMPTDLPSPLPPSRCSSNYIAATAACTTSAATSSADAHGASPARNKQNSTADAPVTASQVRTSRNDVKSDEGHPAALSQMQSVGDEKNVSASAEYVRRGRGNGKDAVQRNTGFMNFEAVAASQSMTMTGKATTNNAHQQQLQHSRNAHKTPLDHSKMPPWPATTMAPAFDSVNAAAQDSANAARRRVSADEERPSSGLQPFASPSLQPGSGFAEASGNKKLLPGATTIDSNGPQWPSAPAIEIPTIPSVASIGISSTRDASISTQQSSNVYENERTPIPTSTKVRTLVIVDSRCRETSNVTYDNTMVIATTEDDFEEYDVDEVREATPGQKELIQSDLLKELCDTLLMGCNAAILGADSRPTCFSAQVLKSVVHTIFAEMSSKGTHHRGRLSASIVKVKGEFVVDLLKDSGDAQKLVIAISPLFGSCVHGVTYENVSSAAAFNNLIDGALSRATSHDNNRDYGFVFCSLLFKLRLEEEGDVQVCSLVATFAGENVGLYTSVLGRSPLVPRALFHYALGGPSYTIALLGIGSEETRANQMLQVQRRLGEMSNRATHPGSVAKFVAGIRNDLTPNLIAKYENSRDPLERAATKEMIERLAEMVKDADALLVDFDHHQPKAYLHGDADQQQGNTADGNKQQQQKSSPSLCTLPTANAPSDSNRNTTNKNEQSGASAASSSQNAVSPARLSAARRALPSITAVNPDTEGERIQSLVCFKQVMMGAGTVAVQGNTILCSSQGGTRFDSDEVITCDENHRSLSSKLIDELVAKFLSGHHTGLLAADSSYSAFTPIMLRHIAYNIIEAVLGGSDGDQDGDNGFAFTKPPTVSGKLQVSIALVKDDVTADLLPMDVDATYHRFEMEHKPLYGPRLVGVAPHLVANQQDFDHFLAVAIDNADPALQTADPGIMVVSFMLTQRVAQPVEDVLVSSMLCTAVFDAVHHYERVLEGNPSEPLDLFKNMLRGPCFSVAMLGISDEEEDPGKLLRALNDLSHVRNRAPQVNSVSRHITELQRGIVQLKERMTTSSSDDERAYIQNGVEMAEKLLEEAESLRRNPLSLMQPCAFVPLGGAADLH